MREESRKPTHAWLQDPDSRLDVGRTLSSPTFLVEPPKPQAQTFVTAHASCKYMSAANPPSLCLQRRISQLLLNACSRFRSEATTSLPNASKALQMTHPKRQVHLHLADRWHENADLPGHRQTQRCFTSKTRPASLPARPRCGFGTEHTISKS